MTSQILKARLDMLERNLAHVMEVAVTIKDQRTHLEKLMDLPDVLKDLFGSIDSALNELTQNRENAALDRLRDVQRNFDSVKALRDDATEATKAIRPELDSLPITLDFSRMLASKLVERAEDGFNRVGGKRGQLSDPPNGPEPAHITTWTEYHDSVRHIHQVFSEYFDFLGGWALRNAGFDQGVCRLADELVLTLPVASKLLPTLPARQAALDRTLARIIRIGFPEWTIWALPLMAHELAHVVLRSEEDARPRSLRDVYVADAFATRVMGAAYPCAEIFLRLDPRAKSPAASNTRVQVMLGMLKRIGEERHEGDFYAAISERLLEEWRKVVDQSGVKDVAVSETHVKDWIEIAARKFSKYQCLTSEEWATVEEWSRKLLEEDGVAEIGDELQQDVGKAQLRIVLNAAWHCRVMNNAEEAPIRERAKQLWNLVADARSGSGRERRDRSTSTGSTATTPSGAREIGVK